MKAIITILVFLLSFIIVSQGQSPLVGQRIYPQAKVRVRVINEVGNPVANVNTRVGFCSATNHSEIVRVEGATGTNGLFVAQGYSYGELGARLTKDGFYSGAGNIPRFSGAIDDRWQPWDATYTTVLRKIENPVPVYAKMAWVEVPEIGKPCGYDLIEGDWVSPWGKGKVADFVFILHRDYTNRRQFEVTVDIGFSNPQDGIQETELPKEFAQSEFVWPRQAPENGYNSTLRSTLTAPGRIPRIQDVEKQKFIFRVRTVEKDEKIVSALYGKLSEGFQLAPSNSKTCMIKLCYYLNPTPLDRNMEFDLKRNLLKNVGQFEEPRRP